MYPSAQVQVYPLTSSPQVAPLLQGFEAHSFVSINWQLDKWWIHDRSACHYEHYNPIYIVDSVLGKAFAQHSITIVLNCDDDDDIITRTGVTRMLHSGNHWPGYVAISLTKLNHMAMSNVDIQFNISRKTRLYVINTLGFLFDWVGSYCSFDSQSNGPGDSFWMSKVAEWMHHKQQMLYIANGQLFNILKVQIRFKNKLDILVTWYDDFLADSIVYGA